MRIISHRGNIYGPQPETENLPDKILYCIEQGYDVEIDLWKIDDSLFLGHDIPTYEIKLDWIETYTNNLWVHCKNIEALESVKDNLNAFGHTSDDYVLTTQRFIWVYPGKPLVYNSIAVLPENTNYSTDELRKCYAICSDYARQYSKL